MEIDDEFFKDVPVNPSDDFLKFIEAHPDFNTHQLIYRFGWENGKRVAICKCTACGREFSQEYVSSSDGNFPHTYSNATFGFRHGEFGNIVCGKMDCLCPLCGEAVKVLHVSDFNIGGCYYRLVYESFLKVEVIKGTLCFFVYNSERYVDKDGNRRIYTSVGRSNVYTKRDKKTVVDNPYKLGSWHVNRNYTTYVGGFDSSKIYPFTDDLLVGTDFENAKLEKYCFSGGRVYPAYYILTYIEHPNVENLVMNGASYYLSDRLGNAFGYYSRDIDGINFAENRPSKMLWLTKDEFSIFVKNRLGYSCLNFYLNNKTKFSLDEVVFMSKVESIYGVGDIMRDKFNPVKICRYLLKQRERSSLINYMYLKDYWELSKKVGIPITDENRFPKNLKGLHDNFTARIEQEKRDSLKKKYEERIKVLDKFSFEKGGLLIRPCASDAELFNEGKKLDHCVYGYAAAHCNGTTAIFFIRTKKQPDEPYYTLEFDEKKIRVKQNHGYKNDMYGTKPKPPEIVEFVELWLKRCKEIKEKENEKSSSKAKSRVASAIA